MDENIKRRRRDNQTLKNVISLRMNDAELLLLKRMSETTSKNASEILREAFTVLHRSATPELQS